MLDTEARLGPVGSTGICDPGRTRVLRGGSGMKDFNRFIDGIFFTFIPICFVASGFALSEQRIAMAVICLTAGLAFYMRNNPFMKRGK